MTSVSRTATRRTVTQAPAATAAMKALAKTFYEENNSANDHSNKAKKARASLLTAMLDANLTSFTTSATLSNGKTLQLNVNVDTPETDKIDLEKLAKLVSHEQFMQIVSASVKSVTDIAGSLIADQCRVPTPGTTNVSVKPVK